MRLKPTISKRSLITLTVSYQTVLNAKKDAEKIATNALKMLEEIKDYKIPRNDEFKKILDRLEKQISRLRSKSRVIDTFYLEWNDSSLVLSNNVDQITNYVVRSAVTDIGFIPDSDKFRYEGKHNSGSCP